MQNNCTVQSKYWHPHCLPDEKTEVQRLRNNYLPSHNRTRPEEMCSCSCSVHELAELDLNLWILDPSWHSYNLSTMYISFLTYKITLDHRPWGKEEIFVIIKATSLPLVSPIQMLKALLCHLLKRLQWPGPPALPRPPGHVLTLAL